MRTLFYLMVGCIITSYLPAQNDLKIGQWRSHLPYQFGRYITQSPKEVYYTTDWAVLAMDKEDLSVERISKVEELSEAGTDFVKYDPTTESLIVAYSSSRFDVIQGNTTTTFTNIREDGNFFNRVIHDISLAKPGKAYFSTGFGVVEFDLVGQEFGFTANLDVEVFGFSYHDGFFYAATEEGIYQAADDPGINLKDISNWKLLGMEDGFPVDYWSSSIVTYKEQLYFDISDSLLYRFDGQELDSLYYEEGMKIDFLTAEAAHLLIGVRCIKNCSGKVIFYDGNGFEKTDGKSCTDRPRYAIETPEGQVWYADNWRDLRMGETPTSDCQKFKFDSPFSEFATDLVVSDQGELFVATEPTRTGKPALNPSGFFRYVQGSWEFFNRRNIPILKDKDMLAFYRIAISPLTGKVYVGTFYRGLVEFDGENEFMVYDENNSTLARSIADPNVTRIGGVAFDGEGNLWVSNHTAQNPISVLKPDGSWFNDFPKASPAEAIRQIVVDRNGYKWFIIDGESRGILVYDSGILEDPTDDRSRIITVSNTELPSNKVNCLEVDLDGDVWVGTSEGVVVFECGSNVFDDNCQGAKRIVEVGGFNAFLLEDENVLSIAADGANRKWFGTESGIFVQSANGEEQIAFFNEDNSPLFDNVIFDIAINNNSGEVFIGTAKGLISYRSDAIGGGVVNKSNVYAYPNPVRPDYEGPIAIKGLARNADVKITDISGQLVFETKALGGQAIWDGRDYNGRKANSGVYLVFSTSTLRPETPDAVVTKILLIN